MKQILLATLLLAGAVHAADSGDSAYFGRIDLTIAGPPSATMHARPVLAEPGPAAAVEPVYLHIRPTHAERWGAHCREYAACTQPALFVTEQWYRQVYLPRIGRDDGREQRYLETVRLGRAERHNHHREAE